MLEDFEAEGAAHPVPVGFGAVVGIGAVDFGEELVGVGGEKPFAGFPVAEAEEVRGEVVGDVGIGVGGFGGCGGFGGSVEEILEMHGGVVA